MSRNNREWEEVPDPEVVLTAKNRDFSAEEMLCILEEALACELGTSARWRGGKRDAPTGGVSCRC
ncbi:MAG: hypothetical protein PVG71_10315 [Anaerolineae bacterium]|jgi:hypothetical protein